MQVARVRWVGGEQFLGVGPSGHAIPLDSDRKSNTAPGPMEMLLHALGACTATDVVSILKKKRQKLEALEIEVTGERAKEPPAVWLKLELVYRLRGKLDEKAVKDAIHLSEEKYCSVAAMLRKTATIHFRYEILPA
ncbi:MAG: OsmC family protein [Bryobacteraceae bacterium]